MNSKVIIISNTNDLVRVKPTLKTGEIEIINVVVDEETGDTIKLKETDMK